MSNKPMVVIANPTIMDGLVVRWYLTIDAAQQGADVISASRNRVYANGEITPELFHAAWDAHLALKQDRPNAARGLATHKKSFLGGMISPISEPVTSA